MTGGRAAGGRRPDTPVTVTTGCTRGLGPAVVERFLWHGATVVAADLDGDELARAACEPGTGHAVCDGPQRRPAEVVLDGTVGRRTSRGSGPERVNGRRSGDVHRVVMTGLVSRWVEVLAR